LLSFQNFAEERVRALLERFRPEGLDCKALLA
jgi:hypothetical protein